MPDDKIILYKFQLILDSIDIILERFVEIKKPDDFATSSFGVTQLDSIAMRLQFIGESFKKIDQYKPDLFNKYGNISWNDIIRLRDLLSHHYDIVNPVFIFNICNTNLADLKTTIEKIIKDNFKEQ